jgi:uncharacterized damage-inducible protein DinB
MQGKAVPSPICASVRLRAASGPPTVPNKDRNPPPEAIMAACFIDTDAQLASWQGHRRLTRRMIEAFPEDQLFTFSVGGMRPFGDLAKEMLAMAVPMVRGLIAGEWDYTPASVQDRADLLRQWDRATDELEELWRQIPPEKFAERTTAFGQYEDVVHNLILYVIDNEIHHRGQGYVYLRALGIEPPPFWER